MPILTHFKNNPSKNFTLYIEVKYPFLKWPIVINSAIISVNEKSDKLCLKY